MNDVESVRIEEFKRSVLFGGQEGEVHQALPNQLMKYSVFESGLPMAAY